MEPVEHNFDAKLLTLTDEELDQFFHVLKDNITMFAKVFPPTPFIKLLEDGEYAKAYAVIKYFQSVNQ